MFHTPCLPCPPLSTAAGAGVLNQELRHAGGSQVEFYTLDYAAALAPHSPTWPLGAAYLAWCPAHGQAALEALLRRLPLDAADAWPARKAAELAAFQGLSRVAEGGQGVVGVAARSCIRRSFALLARPHAFLHFGAVLSLLLCPTCILAAQ